MTGNEALAAGTGSSVVVERCQVCSSEQLEPVIFLGFLPPVNRMRDIGTTPTEEASYPALLLECGACGLVQLGLVVDKSILFPPEYPYTSGTTRILRDNFAEMYTEVQELYPLGAEDLVVDVGSNDGTLLSNFQAGHRVHGIEPSDRGLLARERGIETTIAFLEPQVAAKVRQDHGPAKLVTATNVFAHIEDVPTVVESILSMLDDDGIFLSESHYLGSVVETLQYDTIYHEHLRYYSLASLTNLLERHGLEVIHARPIPTHGGSIRVYAARKGAHPVRETVPRLREKEAGLAIRGEGPESFKGRVVRSKLDLLALLGRLKAAGARIHGVGAPSRASTLINYVGLDDGILDYVLEVPGSYKIGKTMPGTMIPVVAESKLFEEQPEYAMLLSWHIAEELIPKISAKGFRGRYIVPLPTPRILENDGSPAGDA